MTLHHLIDGIFLVLIFYKIFKSIKGTRGITIFIGFLLVALMYGIALNENLEKTKSVLSPIFNNLFIVIIFLFQEEFKKIFADLGSRTLNILRLKKSQQSDEIANILTVVCFDLSKKHLGALIVIENDIKFDNIKEKGSVINCEINQQILYSIFTTGSTLHDGAVIIANNKIESAGCHLPLSNTPTMDKKLGTRHRAALGLSEITDATIILVSEETTEIKVVCKGVFKIIKSQDELKSLLTRNEDPFSFKKFFS